MGKSKQQYLETLENGGGLPKQKLELTPEVEAAIIDLVASKLYIQVEASQDYLDFLDVKVTVYLGEHEIEATERTQLNNSECQCQCQN